MRLRRGVDGGWTMNIPATATKRWVSGYDRNPDYRIDFLAAPGRVRVRFNGVTVADSGRAMEMREGRYPPVYYLPREDEFYVVIYPVT